AFDYFTTFNRTLFNADACTGQASASACASPTTFAIPVDPQLTAGEDGIAGTADDVTQVAGNLTIYGGTISSVSYGSSSNPTTGSGTAAIAYAFPSDWNRTLVVIFTVSTSNSNAVLPRSGHIACNFV